METIRALSPSSPSLLCRPSCSTRPSDQEMVQALRRRASRRGVSTPSCLTKRSSLRPDSSVCWWSWGMTPAEAGQCSSRSDLRPGRLLRRFWGAARSCFNLNGRVPDEGAVAEATMAWMLGKPIVFYKADYSQLDRGARQSASWSGQTRFERMVRSMDAVGPALERAIRQGRAFDPNRGGLLAPPHLGRDASLRACGLLRASSTRLGPERPAEPIARIVRGLFRPELVPTHG